MVIGNVTKEDGAAYSARIIISPMKYSEAVFSLVTINLVSCAGCSRIIFKLITPEFVVGKCKWNVETFSYSSRVCSSGG